MATVPEVTKTPSVSKPITVDLHQMLAVHGLLIHPYTLTHFNISKPLPHVLDVWCQTQIDADKLKIV